MKLFQTLLLCLFVSGCIGTMEQVKTGSEREPPPRKAVGTWSPPPAPPPPPVSPVVTSPAPRPNLTAGVGFMGEIYRPGVHAIVTSSPKPKQNKVNLVFRDYLLAGFTSNANPYNFVLLPRRPSNDEEMQQYMDVCRNWLSIAPIVEAKSAPAYIHPVPFYWLVKSMPKNETCEELIQVYDYTRAQYYAVERGLDLSKLYLVYDLPDGNVLMDITRVTKRAEMTKSFQLWRSKTSSRISGGTIIRARTIFDSAASVLSALSSFIVVK